jgi:hypothetical protein
MSKVRSEAWGLPGKKEATRINVVRNTVPDATLAFIKSSS